MATYVEADDEPIVEDRNLIDGQTLRRTRRLLAHEQLRESSSRRSARIKPLSLGEDKSMMMRERYGGEVLELRKALIERNPFAVDGTHQVRRTVLGLAMVMMKEEEEGQQEVQSEHAGEVDEAPYSSFWGNRR